MNEFIEGLTKSRNKGLWLQAKMYAKFFDKYGDTETSDSLCTVIREKHDSEFNVSASILSNTLYSVIENKEEQDYE